MLLAARHSKISLTMHLPGHYQVRAAAGGYAANRTVAPSGNHIHLLALFLGDLNGPLTNGPVHVRPLGACRRAGVPVPNSQLLRFPR